MEIQIRRIGRGPLPAYIGALLALLACAAPVRASVIELRGAAPRQVARCARYEVAFDLPGPCANPYDPEEVDAGAVFTAPSGRRITVPAFYCEDFAESAVADGPAAAPIRAGWRVRFAPRECGTYRAALTIRRAGALNRLPLPDFVALPSANPGFIRATRGPAARTLFENGRAFVPVGECFWMPRSLKQFDEELDRYAAHGLNYFRFFTSHDSMFFFESASQPVGRYNQLLLARLDRLFQAAEARGVYLMPCLEMFSDYRITQPYPYWDQNAYNRKNGGPCAGPADFFTLPEARRLFRSKLRYFMARYGSSTSLFCLQLFAEADGVEKYDLEAGRAWHREMAGYIHAIDPYGHPVSTSTMAWDSKDPRLFAIPHIDLVLNELYNACDFAAELSQDNRTILRRYGKPAFLAEAGITFEYFVADDPTGIHIHNATWANALSGGIGAPTFWWTSYIREKNLLPHLAAFARFAAAGDFAGMRPVRPAVVARSSGRTTPDLILTFPYSDPPGAAGPQTIRLSNRRIPDRELPNLPRNLYPRYNQNGSNNGGYNPLTLITDFAADGALNIQPRWIGGPADARADLRVFVDDRPAGSIAYNGCPMDDWTAFLRRSRELCVVTTIPIPRGKHTIRLENHGTLYISTALDLTNYFVPTTPNARVLALADDHRACLWVQNRDNTWWRGAQGKQPRPIEGVEVTFTGMRDGEYAAEWWDTYRGEVISSATARAVGGRLTVSTGQLRTDAACWVRRVEP